MKYKIYEHYIRDLSLFIGVFCEVTETKDVIETCLDIDKNFGAKIALLYNSVYGNYKLPKDIVNILEHEDKISILELKKNSIRLTFFIDYDGIDIFSRHINKSIVFLSYFKKEKPKTPKIEIVKAKKIRDIYLEAKKNKTLEMEIVKSE